jgi:hypothetical protein
MKVGVKPVSSTGVWHKMRQISSPTPAAGSVAERSRKTRTANPQLNTKGSSKARKEGRSLDTRTAPHASRGTTTPTSTRDCTPSRPCGIAFLHPVSCSPPCISSPISRPAPYCDLQSTLSIDNISTVAGAVLHLARIEAEGSTQSRPSRRTVRSVVQALQSPFRFGVAAALLASALGCGNNYRPVVSAINPVGPAGQPEKFAVVVSSTGTSSAPTPGLVTFVDFAGDTVLITANIGVDPYYLILNSGGTTGFTLNSDHTLTSFDVDTSLLTSNINQTTLLPGANPASIFPSGTSTYVSDPGQSVVSQFTGALALSLQQQFSITPPFSPIYTVGVAGAPRAYVISPNTAGGNGQVSTIEVASNTIDPNPLPTGVAPVYGVMTADGRRAFIMNEGSNNVTVVNAQTNQLDNSAAIPNATISDPKAVAPIWADFAPALNEMVVANAGDGVSAGSVSIVSIPLCSATALPNNPNCDLNNPIDGIAFGTVQANVTAGIHPVMVGVLQDVTNSRAYVANSGDTSLPCALPPAVAGVSTVCSVTVVNLVTNTPIQTIYSLPDSQCTAAATPTICGHPAYIAVTSGTPTGKVYVVSTDSQFMSVIRTDINTVDTQIPLQGNGVSVRVTAP